MAKILIFLETSIDQFKRYLYSNLTYMGLWKKYFLIDKNLKNYMYILNAVLSATHLDGPTYLMI